MLHRVRWICAPRDNNTDTYWQSDGPQPHLVNIQFHKKVSIKEIGIFCDFKQDESYTPSKISIRAGTHFHDLQVRAPTRALPREHSSACPYPITTAALCAEVLDFVAPQEVQEVSLEEPSGWLTVCLTRKDLAPLEDECETGSGSESLRAFMLQIAVLANHENGRDSHIRQIKVFGPRPDPAGLLIDAGSGFSTEEFSMYSSVR